MKRRVRVRVREIVVDGVSAKEAPAFRQSLEREIVRKLQSGGVGSAAGPAGEVARKIASQVPKEARKP